MDSYYLYQRQYRQAGGAWKNTSIYSVDGWKTQEKVVAQIDPSECDEWNPTDDCKVALTLEDCTEVCIPCDGSRSVTRADLGEYKNRAIIAEFGCCIDTIDGVFQDDTMIKKVIIPDCITAITEASFYGTEIEGLVIPASVTYIGSQAKKLAGLKWARFLGTVPPTLAAYCSLGGNCPIYVPPGYVDVYKSASVWRSYQGRIQAWQGQVETDYEVECTPPPTPDTGETGTTYETWIEDETAFTCSDTTKYHVEYAWTSSTGSEGSYVKTDRTRTGDLWETGSTDCGYVPPAYYKWEVDYNDYVCDGVDKNYKEYQWSSATGDDGSWVKTDVSRMSNVWEFNSPDCGYVPPQNAKFTLTLTGGSVVSAECDASSAITSAETTPYSAQTVNAVIGDCVTTLGGRNFSFSTGMTSVTIPNSVTSIGDGVFQYCSGLTSVTIPSGVTTLSDYLFYACRSLSSITFSTNVTRIGKQCFYKCNLSSFDIPGGVTTIEEETFESCHSLSAVTIPETVTEINGFAFIECSGLTSVTIPSGVISIGSASTVSYEGWAFGDCTQLTSITCLATIPPNQVSMNFDNTNNCPIYVPSGSVNAYKNATNWSSYASRIQAIPT